MSSYIRGTRINSNRKDTCVGLESHGNVSRPPHRLRPSDRADVSIGLFSAPKSTSDDGKPKLFSVAHRPGLNELEYGLYNIPRATQHRKSGLVHLKRSEYLQQRSDIDRSDLSIGLDAGARAGVGKDQLVVSVSSKRLKQDRVTSASEGQEREAGWMKKKTKKVLSGLRL